MLEKPDIAAEALQHCLQTNYDLTATAIEFLQLGNDSNGWVYRVATNSQTYFLKVKKPRTVTQASVRLPHYLRQCGLPQIVAPIETQSQTLWADVKDFQIVLYPFIEGPNAMATGLNESQWVEYGAILKGLHTSPLTSELLQILPKEKFQPSWLTTIQEIQKRIDTNHFETIFEKELAIFWQEQQVKIDHVIKQIQDFSQRLTDTTAEFVICHSDIHTANILIASDGGLHVVDWDAPILAPKERDLLFIIGASADGTSAETKNETLFLQGYGSTRVDPLILAYYRYEWVVQEISDFAERVFMMEDVGTETKQHAVEEFKSLFAPGNVVGGAYELDAVLN